MRSKVIIANTEEGCRPGFHPGSGLLLLLAVLVLYGCGVSPGNSQPAVTPAKNTDLTPRATPLVNPQVSSSNTPTAAPSAVIQPEVSTPTPVRTQMSLADGAVMLKISEGDFLMGSLEGDGESDEHPQHSVHLDAYWIDQTEVTNRRYEACVAAGVCKEPARPGSYTRVEYYGNPQFLDYPVIYVDWFNASRYCQWAGKRLPTEAEWEKAGRGVDGITFPWGNGEPGLEQANHGWLVGDTAEVGSYLSGASPFGVLDMAGNVMEWVSDWYGEYTTSPYKTYNPRGPDDGSHRVARGGSYLFSSFLIRGAERYWVSPYYADDDLGFRCAFSEEQP